MERIIAAGWLFATLLLAACAVAPNAGPPSSQPGSQPDKPALPSGAGSAY